MRAAVRHTFGPPDAVRIEEIPTPTPRDGEILVRIRAASVNLGDWELLSGEPFYSLPMLRLFGPKPAHRLPDPEPLPETGSARRGPFRPRYKVLGCDFAGEVEAVGKAVTRFQVGDEVFGDCMVSGFGAFAERICVPESGAVVTKPQGMTFEEAASLPQASFIALQAIEGKRAVGRGQRVLINGAGGSAGTLAVQLAKARGAEVTAVDLSAKEELIRSLGADHFIDFTKEDFSQGSARYDLIFDVVASRSVFRCRRALRAGGAYIMVGGSWRPLWQSMALGPLISLATSRKVALLMMASRREDLIRMCEHLEAGTVKAVIDRCYPLEETAEAIRRVAEKRSLGKVIVTM